MNFVDVWDSKAYPGKILRIRPTEIEFESNFSIISHHLRSTEYSNFLIAEILKIRPSEIECEDDFSTVYHNNLIAIYLSDH